MIPSKLPLIFTTFLVLSSCWTPTFKKGDCALAPKGIEVFKKIVRATPLSYEYCVFEEIKKEHKLVVGSCRQLLRLRRKDFDRINKKITCPLPGYVIPQKN